ncbi:unnamed protein product [Microthlaspi erraticum]|uniref:Alanine--tRNA ligase n=1 Tax=Microthlaspi erraticum TaxID=1685480 RepID=A0A6D2HZN6_9BRAS|nr:unnamed protein product [Microthlaspi erraticum]
MLGNWSFGDYFKKEAIEWAWELLTEVYGLPSDRIYATYFEGDVKSGIQPDNEARDIWLKFLPSGRVLPFGCKFNRETKDGPLKPLPSKHVDTGMGFERLTSVLQNKMSNYDTDVFLPIFDDIQKATGARPYSGKVGQEDVDRVDTAYRVVADHIRTLSIAIADGSRPGNEGRQHVLKSILRRAVRYGKEILKAEEGFFNGLVSSVIRVMGDAFPELKEHEKNITKIIKEEEASFCKTLEKMAFKLSATYGFPLDLTQLMAEEIGLVVDVDGFKKAEKEARDESKNAHKNQTGVSIAMDVDTTSTQLKTGVSATDDSFKYTWFQDHETEVKAIYNGSALVESFASDDKVGLVLASTSFYPEQGGQIFDTGLIEGSFGTFRVCNVQTVKGFVLHSGNFSSKTGIVSVGDKVTCKVDYERRKLIANNHTCTHMLTFALKKVLGDHIKQKGSKVLPEKLRFDFSHGRPVDPEDLRKIDSIVNKMIDDELDVFSTKAALSEAKRINGLREALGEASYDPVRVVAIGRQVEDLLADPESDEWSSLSTEFCGGTHIRNTRDAKAFAIVSEEGVARGIRRITALTGEPALAAINLASLLEKEVEEASEVEGAGLEEKVTSLKRRAVTEVIPAGEKANIMAKIALLESRIRKAQKEKTEQNLRKAVEAATEAAESAAKYEKTFCIVQLDVGLDSAALREAVSQIMEKKEMPVMMLSTDETTNKAVFCAGVPVRFKELDVTEWCTVLSGPLKGKCGKAKGGLASGPGTDASQVKEALRLAGSFASLKLTSSLIL